MEAFYFPRPGSQSPVDEFHRRQLDVLAPFILVDEGGPAIACIANYLRHVSVPILASSLGEERVSQLRKTMNNFNSEYRNIRAAYRKEFALIWELNWMRLMAEHQLLKLGEPNPYIEKGLFSVSEPLGEDRDLFRGWVKKVEAQRHLKFSLQEETKRRRELLVNGRLPVSRPCSHVTTLDRRRVSLRRAKGVSKWRSATSTPSRRLVNKRATQYPKVKRVSQKKGQNFSRASKWRAKSNKRSPKHMKTARTIGTVTSPTTETAMPINKQEILRNTRAAENEASQETATSNRFKNWMKIKFGRKG